VDYNNPGIILDTIPLWPLYAAQEGDSILYYSSEGFQTLWRITPQAGESFQFDEPGWPFTYTINVDSLTSKNIGGFDVNLIWLSGGTGFGQNGRELVYDQFGPTHGFFYYDCWGALDCTPLHLCRYANSVIGEVQIDGKYCENLPTTTYDIFSHGNIGVYPNPTSGIININFGESYHEPVLLDVYTVSGRLVYSERVYYGTTVDLSAIEQGVYICRVIAGNLASSHLLLRQ
jgi:hypothetical protein